MSIPTPDLLDRLKYLENPVTVSLTTTTARSAALAEGIYEMTCDVDAYILQGDSSVDATTSGVPLYAKEWRVMHVGGKSDGTVDTNENYLAGILASGTGTLTIVKRLS